ncbi:hypothetical protein HY771_00020 [Candidatus Uhrbacteria bacterium]|nr:hypothetical protein [Candidatus Uhrbacteria bacterium]
MFRIASFSQKSDTEFFDVWIGRISTDQKLYDHAEAILHAAATAEPLVADSLHTPQDIRYHAEGPFVRDHLRLMLMSLYAIVEGKMPLSEIEELRRLKGYEYEVEELEELFKAEVAWFEAFILCHDAAKWATVTFKSPENSRGAELGFNQTLTYEPDVDLAERSRVRSAYLDLFESFTRQHPNESQREIQSLFYLTYEIDVKYPHHDHMIHSPVYHALFERFAIAHELTDVHAAMLEDIISHHLSFKKFADAAVGNMNPFVHLAQRKGYDSDDFVDFIQGAIFLDFVCGSKRLSAHGYWHEISMLVNALKAEHDVDPMQRAEKIHAREEQEHKQRNLLFREVGLDGISLMDVLQMEPGPAFGRALKQVQSAVVGQAQMPVFGKKIDEEIERRAGEFYKKLFKTGE